MMILSFMMVDFLLAVGGVALTLHAIQSTLTVQDLKDKVARLEKEKSS